MSGYNTKGLAIEIRDVTKVRDEIFRLELELAEKKRLYEASMNRLASIAEQVMAEG